MHPAGAAERDQRQRARVDPALHRDHAQRAHHLDLGHGHDPDGRLDQVEGQLAAQPGDRPLGQLAAQGHAAAEHRAVAQVAEGQVGVGHGRLVAALPVGRRSRCGARRARPDAQRAAGVGPGHRAAARAHGVDVDRRVLDRDARDDRRGRRLGLAAEHHRDVGAGAAHVEREEVGVAAGGGHEAGSDHAAGRAREDAGRRAARGGVDVEHAARGLHHQRRRQAGGLEPAAEPAKVRAQRGREVGVGHRGREALVLAELARDLARERDVQLGARGQERRADLALVRRVGVGVQQAHGHRLDARVLHRLDGGGQGLGVDRPGLALGRDPLRDHDPPLPRHQGRRPVLGQVVQRGPVLAADLDHVPEALGGDQRGGRAAPLEQGVRGHGGAVGDRLDRRAVELGRLDRREHPDRLVAGRRGHLRGAHLAVDDRHEIGERPADVDADARGACGAIRVSLRLVVHTLFGRSLAGRRGPCYRRAGHLSNNPLAREGRRPARSW